MDRLCSTLEDRCRIPWKGGAVRLRPDIVIPIMLVPCGILLASVGPVWTVVAFAGTLAVLFAFYRMWRRRQHGRRRTHVFFVYGVTSIAVLYYVFISVVVGYREIFLWEILLLTAMLAAMIYYMIQARRDPGIIHRESLPGSPRRRLYSGSEDQVGLSEFEVVWVDSRPIRSKYYMY